MTDLQKKILVQAVKFNIECLEMGIIKKDDFVQAIEEELKLV